MIRPANIQEMNSVTIKVGDEDLKLLEEIFKNEEDFKPQVKQDYLLIGIMRQVLDNPKTKLEDETNA